MARVGYFWEAQLSERETGFFCPEKPQRGEVLAPQLIFHGAGVAGLQRGFASCPASILEPVHDPDYIETVRNAPRDGKRFLDAGETAVTPNPMEDALLVASAGCEVVDQVVGGQLDAAFCAVRPPATMPTGSVPWASAFSTIWRWPPPTPSVATGLSG